MTKSEKCNAMRRPHSQNDTRQPHSQKPDIEASSNPSGSDSVDTAQESNFLRLTYRPTLSSRTEYALFRTAGLMRLVDPSTSDGKAFLEFGGKIQMTQMTSDIAAAD